jgi:MFS transporter, AAHS family, 4-hydroxybenzoate transporter
VFGFGGAVPLVIAVAMYFWLPESLQFMVVRRRRMDEARRSLKRVDPGVQLEGAELVVPEENRGGVPCTCFVRAAPQGPSFSGSSTS